MLNTDRGILIEKQEWGKIGDTKVYRFCLQNTTGTRLYVSNFGATAQALFMADRYGRFEDILLGYDSLQEYEKDGVYMGAVVGRYANRIAGGVITIEGTEYPLATRDGGYHLHGGTEGFNKKLFDWRIAETSNAIIFTYTSDHLEEGFPGKLDVEIRYTLTEENSWIVDYRAQSDQTTIVNLTQHAYFNLTGKQQLIDDHLLKINSRQYLPVNAQQVPTGSFATVIGTPFDFRTATPIGERVTASHAQLELSNGYDHSWVLEETHSPFLKHAALVTEPGSGRKMEVYTTEPAVHFYAGNYLTHIPGKSGRVYHPRSGFCLETQHFPDAPNHAHFPSTVLKAGEEFASQTIFNFSTV